ncbi:MAG: hypothetical protein WAR59_15105 [Ignavibacteriaceae bacterium]
MIVELYPGYIGKLSNTQAVYINSGQQATINRELNMDCTGKQREISGKITRKTLPEYLKRIPF